MLSNCHKLFAVVSLAMACLGCGEDLKPVYPVTGTVIFNGAPLSSGTVTFTPVEDGPSVTGNIREDGTYEIKSHDDRHGAFSGEYKVTVNAVKISPEGIALGTLPAKYSTARSSGLTADVKEVELNKIDFELTGRPN